MVNHFVWYTKSSCFHLLPDATPEFLQKLNPSVIFNACLTAFVGDPKAPFSYGCWREEGQICSSMLVLFFLPTLEECKSASLKVIPVEIKLLCPIYAHWNIKVLWKLDKRLVPWSYLCRSTQLQSCSVRAQINNRNYNHDNCYLNYYNYYKITT